MTYVKTLLLQLYVQWIGSYGWGEVAGRVRPAGLPQVRANWGEEMPVSSKWSKQSLEPAWLSPSLALLS